MNRDRELLASLGITAADWWDKMGPKEQQQYLKEHPRSKMKPSKQAPEQVEEPKPVPTALSGPSKEDIMSSLAEHFDPSDINAMMDEFAVTVTKTEDEYDAHDYIRGALDDAYGDYPEDEDEAIGVAEEMNELANDIVIFYKDTARGPKPEPGPVESEPVPKKEKPSDPSDPSGVLTQYGMKDYEELRGFAEDNDIPAAKFVNAALDYYFSQGFEPGEELEGVIYSDTAELYDPTDVAEALYANTERDEAGQMTGPMKR